MSSVIARRPSWHGARQKGFDANHVATTALWAITQGLAGELLVAVAIIQRGISECGGRIGCFEQLPTAGKFDGAIAVGQKAVMPNPLEPARKNMQQEAADQLRCIQGHDFLTRVVAVILPAKADFAINEVDQSIVGDGNPMRVATEILEDVLGSAKWWLGEYHPLSLPHRSQILGEGTGSLKRFKRVEEAQEAGVKGALQLRQKQPAKQPREYAHRQEEPRAAGEPVFAIGTQAAARNHAMQMRVMEQILAPGMKDGDEADLGAQMFGIGSNRA